MRELRYCMVLAADSLTAEKEVLSDPLISVKRWTETMAQRRGMDKNSTEVVDAQVISFSVRLVLICRFRREVQLTQLAKQSML